MDRRLAPSSAAAFSSSSSSSSSSHQRARGINGAASASLEVGDRTPTSPAVRPLELQAETRSGNSPASRAEANVIPPVPEWDDLTLGQIYDELCQVGGWKKGLLKGSNKITRPGDCFNELLRNLVDKKYLEPALDGKSLTLAKNKGDQKVQKLKFIAMEHVVLVASSSSSSYQPPSAKTLVVAYLRENLKVATDASGEAIDPADYDVDVTCRVLMLAHDPRSLAVLESIYNPGSGREVVDDKTQCTEAKWTRVTTDYVNNSRCKPENEWAENAPLIAAIYPDLIPLTVLTTAEVRTIWRFYRNKFTQCSISFHESGNLSAEDQTSQADRFWDRHVTRLVQDPRHQLGVLFMWWMHDGHPPKLCTRSQVPGQATESGLGGAGGASGASGKNSGKRSYGGPSTAELQDMLADSVEKTALYKSKTSFIDRGILKEQIVFCQGIMDDEDSSTAEYNEAKVQMKALKKQLAGIGM